MISLKVQILSNFNGILCRKKRKRRKKRKKKKNSKGNPDDSNDNSLSKNKKQKPPLAIIIQYFLCYVYLAVELG